MLTLENNLIHLELSEDGREAMLADRKRGEEWNLDPSRQTFCRRNTDAKTEAPEPFPPGRVERQDGALHAHYVLKSETINVRWELAADHVRLTLQVIGDQLEVVGLPGVFRPASGPVKLLLPPYQGVLYLGGDEPWESRRPGGAHGNFSLSMAAALSPRGALLATAEDLADWRCLFGEDTTSPFFTFQSLRCPVLGWYPREVRLYPTDSSVTSVAKRYRARIKERNEFVTWEEKIARKPILENLFGALMAFIGYNQSTEIDYVACAQKLHDSGFERVLYCPVRMCNYSLDFLMGGDAPIWLTDEELQRLHEIPGVLLAPWGWYMEALDDGSQRMARLFRRDPKGNAYHGWRIDQQQWKSVCIPYQVQESKARFAGDMRAMDWIHYDVSATLLGHEPCYGEDHGLHDGRPLAKRGDVEWTRRLLGPETNGNRIVSSEGFLDRYAVSYDIGTVKMLPGLGNKFFVPLPLTMLVLHDSCLHDWWETDSYNVLPGSPPSPNRFGDTGSGRSAQKAAMDALYGCRPNVFPFGRQYGWVDKRSRRSFSFLVKLEDAAVQEALKLAMPITQLHKRIGKLEMVSFELLTDDGELQASVFADGTRIIANLGDRLHRVAEVGKIAPHTWLAKQ